jgi:hypothetical protein
MFWIIGVNKLLKPGHKVGELILQYYHYTMALVMCDIMMTIDHCDNHRTVLIITTFLFECPHTVWPGSKLTL